jgi:SAM-dependent methyltransferase
LVKATGPSGVARSAIKAAGRPVLDYLDERFGRIDKRLKRLETAVAHPVPATQTEPEPYRLDPWVEAELEQARHLARIDVRRHNSGGRAPTFDALESQAVSALQCEHPRYLEWFRMLENVPGSTPDDELRARAYNRKVWEWAYIAEAVHSAGLLAPGRTALGFGCGTEPMPALFARFGLDVLATDQASDEGQQDWSGTGQLMAGLRSLSRPHVVSDVQLAERVQVRAVDMNSVPDDIGSFDVIWSSCVIEHLGSPQRGLDFVLESAELLKPGGIMVHTTELELTPMPESQDYGHCAVYLIEDLEMLVERMTAAGFEMSINPYVSLDTPQDRWVSMATTKYAAALRDGAHLRLALGNSVTTSFGLLARRPA